MKRLCYVVFLALLPMSCKDTVLPKPKALLSLEYPEATYQYFDPQKCPFVFERNASTAVSLSGCDFQIAYALQKATLFTTYKKVDQNLNELLRDAQNLTQKHVVKAESISEQPYINPAKKVYGMLYHVTGEAASQTQFYLTDSLHHFFTGSVYFRARPNYDSILPASEYLRKDVIRLMESFEWKD
ncbi:MAG: gliding motility lipoprotein GldD [Flavobacteriaceae bacterium]|nr:gliding motility lipoprotein GldD [Flavobacteriaceae bacterium]